MNTHRTTSRLESGRTVEMTRSIFDRIIVLAHKEAGLNIPDSKLALVQSRISRRLRALHLDDFESYVDILESEEFPDERHELISALTTNVTSFFRESQHFDMLRSKILPRLLSTAQNSEGIRIWSAGCSSGQEAYSIAMCVLDLEPDA